MKRKNSTADASDKPAWRKKGGGSFRLFDGSIIKPNQRFNAYEEEIPEAFLDTVVRLSNKKGKEMEHSVKPVVQESAKAPKETVEPVPDEYKDHQDPKEKGAGTTFEIVSKSPGWYDVINTTTGKAQNEKGLRAQEAKDLLTTLTE